MVPRTPGSSSRLLLKTKKKKPTTKKTWLNVLLHFIFKFTFSDLKLQGAGLLLSFLSIYVFETGVLH
jgi:hypothetical protein